MVCLDARHAKKALHVKANKTGANDAEGLAHLVCAAWYREVRVKGRSAMLTKALFGARSQLLGISLALENQIRGLLKTFGRIVPKGARWTIRKARSYPDNRRRRDRRGHHATPSSTTSGTQQLRRT
jgi:transposase